MHSLFCKKNQYISNCDLLNKHLIKSTYCAPFIDKVVISFSVSDISDKKVYPSKAFLIFYLICSYVSFIKVYKSNKKLFKDINLLDKNCDFQIILSNKNLIDQFLFDFIETKVVIQNKKNCLTHFNFLSNNIKSFSMLYSKKKDSIVSPYNNINFDLRFSLKNFLDIKKMNLILSHIVI